jgi:putative endonuclease
LVRAQEGEQKPDSNIRLFLFTFTAMFCVYILHSTKLDRFYTGFTSNIDVRLEFHKLSPTNKFTGKANDWESFLVIDFINKSQALAIEKHIKAMKNKTYISNLKKYPDVIDKLKSKYASNC